MALFKLIEKFGHRSSAYEIAMVFAHRGENDQAFEWLKKAMPYNFPVFQFILIEPQFANLHDDARWKPLLESIGISSAE